MEGVTNDTGYAHEAVLTFRAWKNAGGRLDYLILDSPFYFGFYSAQNQCHFTIEDVARRAAATVHLILRDFPNAKIVDAEGPGPLLPADWLPSYGRFLTSFQRYEGRPVDYLAMDMHWFDAWHTGYNWVEASRQIINFAHSKNMKVGLGINADDDFVETGTGHRTTEHVTAVSWMQMNRDHIRAAHDAGLKLELHRPR